MAEPQAEPFHMALAHLRDRLRQGRLPPGARITAVELADELGLSTTPVREALSRLVGEGVVEDRRGQGYFVRRWSGADIADLYRISLAHLMIALDPRRLEGARAGAGLAGSAGDDPVGAVEGLFHDWVAGTGSQVLVRAFRVVQTQLGPVRRLEGRVLADLASEAQRLAAQAAGGAARGERLAELRQFHGRRIRESDRLAALLEAAATAARK